MLQPAVARTLEARLESRPHPNSFTDRRTCRWGVLKVRTRTVVLTILAGVSVAACQSIPDVTPWTKATTDLSDAVTQGFHAAAAVNGQLATRIDPAQSGNEEFKTSAASYKAIATTLSDRADDYEKLFGAIADYAGSLDAIAKAADSSHETVDAIAGSVDNLVSAVGGTSLSGPANELVKGLSSELIKIKAAHDFGEAVSQADPVISKVADLLTDDLKDLASTVADAKDAVIRTALNEPLKKQLAYYDALIDRRNDVYVKVADGVIQRRPNAPATSRSLLDVKEADELPKLDQSLIDAERWHAPYRAELGRALVARTLAEQLIDATLRAVEAWKSAHGSLASAVKERRIPESRRLAAIAVRIHDLVIDIRNQSKED